TGSHILSGGSAGKATSRRTVSAAVAWTASSFRSPELELDTWPITAKGRVDPWKWELHIVLRDLATGRLVTWGTDSFGGKIAMKEFLDDFTAKAKEHPGQMPIVVPTSYFRATDYDPKTPTPRLEFTGNWVPFGEGASPPGDPSRLSATLRSLEDLR